MRSPIRIPLFSLAIAFFSASASAQENCDDLSVGSIQYAAFNDSVVEVVMLNNGPIGWGYPSLILFDGNGDTLARREAEFFALSNDQVFSLPILPGAALPTVPFYATVQLWTGFNDSLRCTFFPEASLCPTGPCTTVHPFAWLANGDTTGFELEWTVTETTTNTVYTGPLHIPQGLTSAQADVCLPPGHYTLTMFNPWVTGEGLFFRMTSSSWNSSQSLDTELASGNPSVFTLFEACIDDDNAVSEIVASGITVTMTNGILRATVPSGSVLRSLEVIDAAGRTIRRVSGQADSLILDISDLPMGLLLVRTTEGDRTTTTRRFLDVR